MKRQLLAFVAITALGTACQKHKEDAPPTDPVALITLQKDTTYANRSSLPPRVEDTIAVYNLTLTGSLNVSAIKFSFKGTTPFYAQSAFKNLWVIFKSGAESAKIPFPKLYDDESYYNFNNNLILPGNKQYKVYVITDVVEQFTNTISCQFQIEYRDARTNATRSTDKITGQSIMYAQATLTTKVSATTPLTGITLPNQEVTTLRLEVAASQQTMLKEMKLTLAAVPTVESIKIYDGATVVGTAAVTTQTIAVPLNVSFSGTKVFSIVPKLKAITSSDQSQLNLKTSVEAITYQPVGKESMVYDSVRTGNDIYIYKAIPEIALIPIANQITPGVSQELFMFSITGKGGPVGFKQVALKVLLRDNAGNGQYNDTITIEDLVFLYNFAPVTNGKFLNAVGDPITKITEADTLVYFTFLSQAQEVVIPSNTTAAFTVTGTVKGANHPQDGDLIQFKFAQDVAAPDGYRFAAQGTGGSLLIGLSTTPVANNNLASSFFILSDHAAVGHSSAVGVSTNDHFNGARIPVPTTAQIVYR